MFDLCWFRGWYELRAVLRLFQPGASLQLCYRSCGCWFRDQILLLPVLCVVFLTVLACLLGCSKTRCQLYGLDTSRVVLFWNCYWMTLFWAKLRCCWVGTLGSRLCHHIASSFWQAPPSYAWAAHASFDTSCPYPTASWMEQHLHPASWSCESHGSLYQGHTVLEQLSFPILMSSPDFLLLWCIDRI